MTIAEALTAALQQAGLRDEALAVRLDVSAQQVMRWRTGRQEPNRNNYLRLCELLPGFESLYHNRGSRSRRVSA